jgi:O-antigen biosynthesis protein
VSRPPRHPESDPVGTWLAAENLHLREENDRLREELRLEREQREALLASTSWRLTAPLRFLSARVRRTNDPKTDEGRTILPLSEENYVRWTKLNERAAQARRRVLREIVRHLEDPPTFSLLLRVSDEPEAALDRTIASVRSQSYPHWELCIVDDASRAPHVARALASYATERRVSLVRRVDPNRPEALQDALASASGDFVAVLSPGDTLAIEALAELSCCLRSHPRSVLLYTDEDVAKADGSRRAPRFKPDWDPDLLLAHPYLGRLCAIRRDLAFEVGGFRSGYKGAEEYDLALRLLPHLSPPRVHHVPDVLYHRANEGSTPGAAEACERAAQEALSSYWPGTTSAALPSLPAARRVIWPRRKASVSVIVPTRDRAELLERCARGVLRSPQPDLELLIVDNDSGNPRTLALFEDVQKDERARVIPAPGEFNWSALNNRAARSARGDVLVLLNNDVEIIDEDWLEELVSQAVRPDVGAVGAKLLFADGRVQHAGVWLGPNAFCRHLLRLSPGDDPGYLGQLSLARTLSAVTGACLAVRRATYWEVGGLDERFRVSFNDIDFCLRLRSRGYRVVWTPHVRLFHLESASRGRADQGEQGQLAAAEHRLLRDRWGDALERDPYFNPNLELIGEEVLAIVHPPRYGTERPSDGSP